MKPKKNPEVSLENKKGLFLQIGLVISLLIVLAAFKWETKEEIKQEGEEQEVVLEDSEVDITQQLEEPPPPQLAK